MVKKKGKEKDGGTGAQASNKPRSTFNHGPQHGESGDDNFIGNFGKPQSTFFLYLMPQSNFVLLPDAIDDIESLMDDEGDQWGQGTGAGDWNQGGGWDEQD